MSLDVAAYAFNAKIADKKWDQLWQLPVEEWQDFDSGDQMEEFIVNMEDEGASPEAKKQWIAHVDLAFGGVRAEIEESKQAESFLQLLFDTQLPEISAEARKNPWTLPTEDYIRLFERLSVEGLEKSMRALDPKSLDRYGFEYGRALDGKDVDWVIDFAFQLRPVIKECKTSGSKLVWSVNYEIDDTEIRERAAKHLERFNQASAT